MNYIDKKDLWKFLKTKNWARPTMQIRAQAICQVDRENLTEDDVYEKYGNYSYSTRIKLRSGIRLLREFKEWEKNVNKTG